MKGIRQGLACGWRFGDFKQHRGGFHVSDPEPGEVNVENVLVRAAKIIWKERASVSEGERQKNNRKRNEEKYMTLTQMMHFESKTCSKS